MRWTSSSVLDVNMSSCEACVVCVAYTSQRTPALKIMLVSYRHDFQCDLLCDIVTTWCNLDPI